MSAPDDDDDDAPAAPVAGLYQGPAHASPYPLSRMAPSFGLVDAAREIEKSDVVLASVTGGKLSVIADQIRHLQEQARAVLARAQRDAELHRARCSFEKKAGGVYHLYKRHDGGELWFSLLGPEEWSTKRPQDFEGSFRLEADMSFTRLDVTEDAPTGSGQEHAAAIRALLGK